MHKSFKSNITISMQSLEAMPQVKKFGYIANISKPNEIVSYKQNSSDLLEFYLQ